MNESEAREGVRADKWLWAARMFKTRSLAAAACAGGKVERNSRSTKPAHPLRAGDTVVVTLPGGRRVLRVVALAERRGPASVARALYEDLTPPTPPRERIVPAGVRTPGVGRPTKRERRLIDRLRTG